MARSLAALADATFDFFMSDGWSIMAFFLAWEFVLSLSMIEKLHALNRLHADPKMEWGTFGSFFVNKITKDRHVMFKGQVVQNFLPQTSLGCKGARRAEVVG
jgi:hypothetical protein